MRCSEPTLLIRGSADAAVPLPQIQRADELIKGSELYIMQECKHWAPGEKPEEFSRVVLDFGSLIAYGYRCSGIDYQGFGPEFCLLI